MITSVIPIYKLDEKRKINLEFIYERLIEADIKILFAIQSKKIDSYFKKFKKAHLLNFYKSKYKKSFNKSFLFNSCIKEVDFFEKFILFLDLDIYFPFKNLKSDLKESYEIVKPFNDCYYLNEEKTYEFIQKKEADILPEFKKVSSLGSCAFILNKNIINKIYFNEKIRSWGQEEIDMGAETSSLYIKVLEQSAVHLYHKNNIEKKILHAISSDSNYSKEVIDYHNKYKNENVEIINFSENNYLINTKFKKIFKYKYGYSFENILGLCLAEEKKFDWLLYTNEGFRITENVYSDISKCNASYIQFSGCEISDKFLHETNDIKGFAIKRSLLKHLSFPKVYTKDYNLNKYLTEYFKNIKTLKINNQLIKIKKTNISKPEKFFKSTIYNTVAVFAPHSPDPHSSGGDRLLKIIKLLKDLKYDVHFFCNKVTNQKHIDELKRINVNCYSKENGDLIDYLKNLNKRINYVIFCWYDIGTQYIELVKQLFPEIKIIVDTVDIHWKREVRGLEREEDNLLENDVLYRKEKEKLIYQKANVIFTVTKEDRQEIFNEIDYYQNVKILSNIHEPKHNFYNTGNDILFIGNFLHPPNVSAAFDSINIYKQFAKTELYKNLKVKPKLYIVGSGMPDKVKKICDDDCCVALGEVENLDEIYEKIKVSISPLTWGAGIKGKICDAASRGKIILTSDIGNEGINLIDGDSGFIANNENEFVKKLVEIYKSSKIDFIAKNGKDIVQSLVSKEAAISVLKHTLWAKPITIIIVTYNKANDLNRCINSIIENTSYPNYKIVVYDNASTDNTSGLVQQIQEKHPNLIDYIKSEFNEYFIIPNNKIMEEKKYLETDIVLVNNDIEIITKDWLNYLYSSAYSEYNLCAVGCKILYPDKVLAEAGAELYSDGSGRNIGRGEIKDLEQYNRQRYVGYCSGCLLYMRRDAIERIGVFDERFCPMYYEESDWQYRAHIQGLKTLYEPKVEVVHHESKFKEMKKHEQINRLKFAEKFSQDNIEKYN